MNNKFDELTKSLAQSVTRRGALKKFGVGLSGTALAAFGLVNKAGAATHHGYCQVGGTPFANDVWYTGMCMDINGCFWSSSADCPANATPAGSISKGGKFNNACGSLYSNGKKCSFTV